MKSTEGAMIETAAKCKCGQPAVTRAFSLNGPVPKCTECYLAVLDEERAERQAEETVTPVLELPHRLEPFGQRGWTVARFASPEEAAGFFLAHPDAAMPCWQRMAVVNGSLAEVR